jgi:transposase
MGKRRDLDRDETIKRLLLEGTPSKVIREKLKVSLSTVSRRRQELKVLAIQSQKQYDRHQEQLIEVAQALEKCIDLPEPAFMDIEDIYAQRRWGIEWEIRSRLQPRLLILQRFNLRNVSSLVVRSRLCLSLRRIPKAQVYGENLKNGANLVVNTLERVGAV